MPNDLSPEAQKFRKALGAETNSWMGRSDVLDESVKLFAEHTSEMRARIEGLEKELRSAERACEIFVDKDDDLRQRLTAADLVQCDLRDEVLREQTALAVARERIKELEGGVAHSVTAQQLAIAYSTISDLKALCLTDEKVNAAAERLRLGLQVGRLRKALEEIAQFPIPDSASDEAFHMAQAAIEALSPAEQFDTCERCETYRQIGKRPLVPCRDHTSDASPAEQEPRENECLLHTDCDAANDAGFGCSKNREPAFIAATEVRYNGSGTPCDMDKGACSCGAWHKGVHGAEGRE